MTSWEMRKKNHFFYGEKITTKLAKKRFVDSFILTEPWLNKVE